jgi:bifunctional non-homologous end joining protein LigD
MIENLALLHKAARQLKTILESCGLVPFIMTTGSRGYHIAAPIKPTHTFEVIHEFTRTIAELLVKHNPDHFTITMSKTERGKKVFIDYLRNGFGATSVAPYAIRAQEGAPVATPIEWKELKSTPPKKYTINNIFRRLARKEDAWKYFKTFESTLSL